MPRGRWISTLLTPLATVVRAASCNSDGRAAGEPVPSACARAASDESILGFAFHPTIGSSAPPTLLNSVAGRHNRTCHGTLPALPACGEGGRGEGACTSSVLASSLELAEALLTQ